MWVRIDNDIVDKFLGQNPFGHHDGEERLKIRLREALKDRDSDDVRRLEGRCLHEKFIRCLIEAGVSKGEILDADAMWGSLRGDEMEGWHELAREIATSLAANGRELSRYELKVNEALEQFYAAISKIEGVNIDAVQRILERE